MKTLRGPLLSSVLIGAFSFPLHATTKTLFIGNSITYYNNVPSVVQAFRNADGHPNEFLPSMVANGGWALGPGSPLSSGNHWDDQSAGSAHGVLNAGDFRYVVLQDYSADPTDVPSVTTTYGKKWGDEIKARNPGATILFYVHWPRTDRPNTQPTLDSVYGTAAASVNGIAVPAGDAVWTAQRQRPDMPFYLDYVHPTAETTYLTAAVFYATLYRQSPVGSSYTGGLNAADAAFLQQVAWSTVRPLLTADRGWNPGVIAGNWNEPTSWNPMIVPVSGQSVNLMSLDSTARTIRYLHPAGSSVLLSSLTLEGQGTGIIRLDQMQDTLRVQGAFQQAVSPGSNGLYTLGGSGSLSAGAWQIGWGGTAAAGITGGSAAITGGVTLGAASGGAGQLSITGGTLTAGSLAIAPGSTLTMSGGNLTTPTLTNAGTLDASAGQTTLTVLTNTGILTLAGRQSWQAGSQLNHLGGMATLLSDAGTAGFHPLTINASAPLRLESSQHLAALNISGGVTTLASSPNLSSARVLHADALTFSHDGRLDVANNALLLSNTTVSSVNTLMAAQRLVSSSDTPFFTLAAIAGEQYRMLQPNGPFSLFIGETVASTDVLVRYTLIGDATFDGRLTSDDYAQLTAGFLFHVPNPSWANGDFNRDGLLDYRDFALIDATYQALSPAAAQPLIAAHTSLFGPAYAAALAGEVPEPATLLLLVGGAVALVARRPLRASAAGGPPSLLPRSRRRRVGSPFRRPEPADHQ